MEKSGYGKIPDHISESSEITLRLKVLRIRLRDLFDPGSEIRMKKLDRQHWFK
jgi:hypothetical protein